MWFCRSIGQSLVDRTDRRWVRISLHCSHFKPITEVIDWNVSPKVSALLSATRLLLCHGQQETELENRKIPETARDMPDAISFDILSLRHSHRHQLNKWPWWKWQPWHSQPLSDSQVKRQIVNLCDLWWPRMPPALLNQSECKVNLNTARVCTTRLSQEHTKQGTTAKLGKIQRFVVKGYYQHCYGMMTNKKRLFYDSVTWTEE